MRKEAVRNNQVLLPPESFGACNNWRKCGNVVVQLGNGLCVDCWDKSRWTIIKQ